MATIHYEQRNIPIKENKSVLESLLDAGVKVPNSCWAGVCHSCLMKATSGSPPTSAQTGLTQAQLDKQLFLACQCHPQEDISVSLINRQQEQQQAVITDIQPLTPTIKELTLTTNRPVRFDSGQYLTLWRGQQLARPYAVANFSETTLLKFHIQRVVGGEFSRWIHDEAKPGESLLISDKQGGYDLQEASTQQPILLIAAEAGLGNALLIAKDKLEMGHRGSITLIHWVSNTQELYWHEPLSQLEHQFTQFHFHQVISQSEAGLIETLSQVSQLNHRNIYLTGLGNMIKPAYQYLDNTEITSSQIQMTPFIYHEG